jgi:hypothetical protein
LKGTEKRKNGMEQKGAEGKRREQKGIEGNRMDQNGSEGIRRDWKGTEGRRNVIPKPGECIVEKSQESSSCCWSPSGSSGAIKSAHYHFQFLQNSLLSFKSIALCHWCGRVK